MVKIKRLKGNIIDLFLWGTPMEVEVSKPSNKQSKEAPEDFSQFVVWFMDKNKGVILRHIRRRLIPNRYSVEDVQAYMKERMLDILQKRLAKGNPIEEPKIYFRKLIDFWCVEYQRMHGFCYGLPKRPRCPEAEEEISQYGFVYLPHDQSENGDGNTYSTDRISQLGYIDSSNTDPDSYEDEYKVVGQEPDEHTEAWASLMDMALPEDREILICIFRYNLTVPQVSKELGIAVSTAYQRRDRGLRAISGTLASFIDLDQDSWRILNETAELPKEDIDIGQFFKLD
jgi:hypothetical protein